MATLKAATHSSPDPLSRVTAAVGSASAQPAAPQAGLQLPSTALYEQVADPLDRGGTRSPEQAHGSAEQQGRDDALPKRNPEPQANHAPQDAGRPGRSCCGLWGPPASSSRPRTSNARAAASPERHTARHNANATAHFQTQKRSHTKSFVSHTCRIRSAVMSRAAGGAGASHSPSHLMTPLSKWSVGSVIGDGARSVSLCRSMSTFVTWTKPAALARSKSSHVLLSASTMASRE